MDTTDEVAELLESFLDTLDFLEIAYQCVPALIHRPFCDLDELRERLLDVLEFFVDGEVPAP